MHLSRFCPRFTVRRLMVAVFVAAVALGAYAWMKQRSVRFQDTARYHLSRTGASVVVYYENRIPIDTVVTRADGERISLDLHAWHNLLNRKYLAAAKQPWLPVAPDPPEPE